MRNQLSFSFAPFAIAAGMSLLISGCGEEEAASTASADSPNSVASDLASPATGAAPANAGGEHGGGGGGGGEGMVAMDEGMAGGGGGQGSMEESMSMSAPGGNGRGGMAESMSMSAPGGGGNSGMEGYGSEGMEGYGEPGMDGYPGGGDMSGGYPGGGYPGSGGSYPGSGQGGGQMGGQRGPAEDYSTWTRDDFLHAVRNRDRRILTAIPTQSESKIGDPEFAGLMTDVLAEMSGGGSGSAGGGNPGFPPGFEPGGSNRGGGRLTPPGGAFFDKRNRMFKRSGAGAVDSLDIMLGQAILAYMPQAVQGTRGAANRVAQQGRGSVGSESAPTMTVPGLSSGGPGQMMDEEGMSGEGEVGYESEGQGQYQQPQGNQPNQGFPSAASAVQSGLTEMELVQSVVTALVQNNSLPAWKSLTGIMNGSVVTTLTSDENIQLVLTDTFSAEDLNADMAEQILNLGVDAAFNAPADHQASLEVMVALSTAPLNHFFGFRKQDAEDSLESGAGAMGSGGMAGGMGMGMGSEGMYGEGMSGEGMYGQPGGNRQGMQQGMMGGQPGGGPPGGPPSVMASGMGGADEGEYASGGNDGYGAAPGGYPGSTGFQTGTATGVSMLNVSVAGMFPAAKALWSKSTSERITQLLSSNGGSEILKLAASIPNDSVRHAIFEVMKASYAEGASDTFGTLTASMLDPGMLAILKGLPRQRPARANAAIDPTRAAKETWVQATKTMVMSMRERLRVAATNPDLSYTGAPRVRLHRGAVPQQSIAIVVPGDATESLGDSAPSATKIYYTKTSVTPTSSGQQNSLIAHYEKVSKGFKRADAVSGIMWFDGVTRNSDGTRQTIDVLIQQEGASGGNRNGGGGNDGYGGGEAGMSMGGESSPGMSLGGPSSGGGGGGQSLGGSFSIEVIVVVTRDPQDAAADASVTAAN